MIGTAIGAGLSAFGSIFGGIKRARAAKKAKRMLERQKAENKSWFDRAYNNDPTARASTQQALTNAREMLAQRSRQEAGRNAVTGASNESVAAQQQQANKAVADAVGQVAASADAQKEAANNSYREMQANTTQQLAAQEQQRANNIAQATQGVLAAAASASSGLESVEGSVGDKLKKKTKRAMGDFVEQNDKLMGL